jgi:uncharacterized protein (TIRG00374 family)
VKNWRFWLGMVISLAFLYWVGTQVRDLGQTVEALQRAQYWFLVPALVAYFVGVWIRSLRWHYLLAPTREVPARRLFPVVVIGYMANDVLPARMGEFVRAYALGQREGISKSTSLATVFVERIFDGLAMLAFMGAVAAFMPFVPVLQQVAAFTAALFLGLIAVLFFFALQPALSERIAFRVICVLPTRLHRPLERIAVSGLAGLHVLRDARAVATVLGLSLLAWLCEATMYYLVALGFFPEVPFYVMLLTLAVANLGTMIPSSPGYVGTFHALAVFTLGLFGIESGIALGFTAVLHLALIVPVTLLGFYFLWSENLSLVGLRRLRGSGNAAEPVGPSGPRS